MNKFEKCEACGQESHTSVPCCTKCGVRKSSAIRKASPVLVAVMKSAGARTPAEELEFALHIEKRAAEKRADGGAESAVSKRSALTTATSGHTHLVSGIDEYGSGTTSGERMATESGFDSWHSHPWVREGDKIIIGEALGHTHELATGTDVAKAATSEPELTPIQKAEVAFKKSKATLDTAQAAFEKAHELAPGTGLNKFLRTSEGKKALNDYEAAFREYSWANSHRSTIE
jgi:hypothetical protein